MKFKQSLLLIITTFLMLLSVNSQAGRQGLSFYYGLGLGIASPTDVDATATGDLMFGVEEDGWSLEAIGFGSTEAGTKDSSVDYAINGKHVGIAYRTIENNRNWFKIKVSSTDMNVDYSDTSVDFETSGRSYSFGWGLRMAREARAEIEYTYYDSDDISDPVHMATIRYFWGGSEYQGKSFK